MMFFDIAWRGHDPEASSRDKNSGHILELLHNHIRSPSCAFADELKLRILLASKSEKVQSSARSNPNDAMLGLCEMLEIIIKRVAGL